MMELETKSTKICFEKESEVLTIVDKSTGYRLLFTPSAALFRPVLDGKLVDARLNDIKANGNSQLEFHFSSEELLNFTVILSACQESNTIDFQCKLTVKNSTQLNRLELFPAGTMVTAYDLVNFRNRHHTPKTWPELILGSEFNTNTYSGDWQFAPHPTMFIFRKLETNMFFGALDLPGAFGMYLSIDKYEVKEWHLNYGTEPDGQVLEAGEEFVSPRFCLFVRQNQSVYDTLDDFSKILVDSGRIPSPEKKKRYSWWNEPIYDTWFDQVMKSGSLVPDDLKEQAMDGGMNTASTILNEQFVRDAVAVIKREKLPIRTILIDEGWAISRGQWEPNQDRFPDLRKLVDELHADGFKVVVWWNWAELRDEAKATPAHLSGGGKLNCHGHRMRDYSLATTQEEYVKPLFRKLFSSDPDCYDLDGVKTDFLADKLHADMPISDSTWRGEENYMFHITKLFYNEMKLHKPDAMHLGCSGHFWLADMIDLNRTYDCWSSNHLEHEERCRMLKYTSPGTPVGYDMHMFLENLEEYHKSAKIAKASVQTGNVMYCQDDPFTVPRLADANYYEKLRKLLTCGGER